MEIEDNAFFDSFDEDDEDDYNDGNLEPLTEGASNPLDDLTDFNKDFPVENEVQMMGDIDTTTKPATGIMKNLESLDFGFGPGNLEPQASDTGASIQPPDAGNSENLLNFDFNFGNDVGGFPTNGDPFSSNLAGVGAAGTGDFTEFDFGKLDANFFDKLEAVEVSDQPDSAWGAGTENTAMNPQELNKFWTDSSVPKFE